METLSVSNETPILGVDDSAFRKYGRRLNADFAGLLRWMDANTPIPEAGNVYVASVPEMEAIPDYRPFFTLFYGLLPYEIGYCNGRNSTLNGLEYHKGSEINIAVTDLVLLLGSLDRVRDNRFDVADVEAFFLKRGDAIELYATCLHFAPCKTSDEGFRAVVVLPRGTNMPLPADRPAAVSDEDKLLFAVNKWLLAHPERKPLMEKGAFPGIIGENIEVRWR